jgi:hypothetical protein
MANLLYTCITETKTIDNYDDGAAGDDDDDDDEEDYDDYDYDVSLNKGHQYLQ